MARKTSPVEEMSRMDLMRECQAARDAAPWVRALNAVAVAAASDPDPHHRVTAALERLHRLARLGERKGKR